MEIDLGILVTTVIASLITASVVGTIAIQFKLSKTIAKLCQWTESHSKQDDERHTAIIEHIGRLYKRTEG